MEFNDRMQWHTNTMTNKQGPTLHTQVHQKCNYPVQHFTCNHCWPQHAVDVLWDVMVFDLIRKTFLYGTLCLWRERPCWTVGCPHGQQWICHLPSSWCKDSVPKHRIRRVCVCTTLAAIRMYVLYMYEHMRLCKIHWCHHVYKLVFVLLQSRTEHVWPQLQVKSGAKLNKEVYLLSLWGKKPGSTLVSTGFT